jgi:CrcB protein
MSLPSVFPVAVGAIAGALCRYMVSLHLPVSAVGWPWATFAVNIVGCLLIGLLVPLLSAHPGWKLLLITGFLGSMTTFSSFALETVELVRQDRQVLAILYPLASVLLGGMAVAAGLLLSKKVFPL